jgi:hypothetical protein
MKNYLRNENFQWRSSPASLQEGRILKARANIVDSGWILRVLVVSFFTVIVSLLLWTFSPKGSFIIIFSGLIWYLLPLIFLLNQPNAVSEMSEKININRPFHKPVVIGKEDVAQISVKTNQSHSLRWGFRLFYFVFIPLYIVMGLRTDFKGLEVSALEYIDISLLLSHFAGVAIFLVLIYNGEITTPYQQAINITTRSNQKLWLYTNEPEEILRILKKEDE